MTTAAGLPGLLLETHTAFVLLVGDRVLKWKKPVTFDFVDFGTLDARRRACEAEVELNRRLAPDVYLGVATLRAEDGSPLEHAVVMRRLPSDAALSSLARDGADLSGPVHELARRLASFHARCESAPDPWAVAGVERLRDLWDAGLDVLADATGVVERTDVEQVRHHVRAYLDGRRRLLEERVARGCVRDGHGDLLADDVFVLPDGVRVLDCLDFDPRLRHGDVLLDVASLAMDLERLARPEAATQLLHEYVELTGETHPQSLEDLFIAYRAQVRAMVAVLRAAQDGADRSDQEQQARRLLGLALEHLRRGSVRLVLVGGLPGSGKSTVAESLSQRRGWVVHSSDLVRKELRLPVDQRYTAGAVDRVYDELLRRARLSLERGWSVVLDATWSDAGHRERARDVAAATSSALVPLLCAAPEEVETGRIARRTAEHVSDADVVVHRKLAARADRWPDAHRIDTAGPVQDAVRQADAAVG